MGWTLDKVILVVFSNCNDSILYYTVLYYKLTGRRATASWCLELSQDLAPCMQAIPMGPETGCEVQQHGAQAYAEAREHEADAPGMLEAARGVLMCVCPVSLACFQGSVRLRHPWIGALMHE